MTCPPIPMSYTQNDINIDKEIIVTYSLGWDDPRRFFILGATTTVLSEHSEWDARKREVDTYSWLTTPTHPSIITVYLFPSVTVNSRNLKPKIGIQLTKSRFYAWPADILLSLHRRIGRAAAFRDRCGRIWNVCGNSYLSIAPLCFGDRFILFIYSITIHNNKFIYNNNKK